MQNEELMMEILLEEVVKKRASDLHIQVGLPPMLRVDGSLSPVAGTQSLDEATVERLVFRILDEDQQQILLKDKEFEFSFAFGDLGRFRVNAFHERGNLAAALRLIPNEIKSVQELGLPPVVLSFADYPRGLVLVTGPTGSGKSTTLQRCMIKMLKEKNYELNLITVEDPPEYPIVGARQMPVTNATTEEEKEEAFNLALAASLRSDPDIIMVGEIRTLSSAELTFKAALSGHNVWSTLHANSAPAIINRLTDMGVDSYKLKDPELVRGLLSQRLFKKLCSKCREPIKNHPEHPSYERLLNALGEYGIEQSFIKGKGCENCKHKGITGRIVAAEIIMPDSIFLEKLISQSKKDAVLYWTNELSGRTLKEDAIGKMLKGIIAVEEVERWCGMIDADAVY